MEKSKRKFCTINMISKAFTVEVFKNHMLQTRVHLHLSFPFYPIYVKIEQNLKIFSH